MNDRNTTDCITDGDPEPMGPAMEVAVSNEDVSGLAALVAYWRSRANRAEGRCEAMAEMVAYMRDRIVTLEQREAICNPTT